MCACACSGNLTLSAASLLYKHESRDMQVPERAATAVHAGIGGGTRMWELQYGSVTRDRHHAAGRPFEDLWRLWRAFEAAAEVETCSLMSGKPAIVDEQMMLWLGRGVRRGAEAGG